MPKDNEKVRQPFAGDVVSSESQGFPHDQMITCEECLRANPPTRMSCLYCSAPLLINEDSLKLLQPTLRPPGKHELGHNIILMPAQNMLSDNDINEAATLLKTNPEWLKRLLKICAPLPVARIASLAESQLICGRLKSQGFITLNLSDQDLGLPENVVRVRSMRFDSNGATLQQSGLIETHTVPWSSFALVVTGRVVLKRVEVKERKGRKEENEIISTSEFFADESVIDLYVDSSPHTWRIPANGFDFSCLGPEKSLLANENIVRLLQTILSRSPQAIHHDAYGEVRQFLDSVWGAEQETHSSGWKRESLGKYSLGAATIESSEIQFTRYSRLQFYLLKDRLNAAK